MIESFKASCVATDADGWIGRGNASALGALQVCERCTGDNEGAVGR